MEHIPVHFSIWWNINYTLSYGANDPFIFLNNNSNFEKSYLQWSKDSFTHFDNFRQTESTYNPMKRNILKQSFADKEKWQSVYEILRKL